MKKAVLLFPDSIKLADFVISERVDNAEVNSVEQTLTAPINGTQIVKAEAVYGVILKAIIPKN